MSVHQAKLVSVKYICHHSRVVTLHYNSLECKLMAKDSDIVHLTYLSDKNE